MRRRPLWPGVRAAKKRGAPTRRPKHRLDPRLVDECRTGSTSDDIVAGLTRSRSASWHDAWTNSSRRYARIFKTFHPGHHRRRIRKAQACGLSTEFRYDLDALASLIYRLHTLTPDGRLVGRPRSAVEPHRSWCCNWTRQLLEKGLGFVALTKFGRDVAFRRACSAPSTEPSCWPSTSIDRDPGDRGPWAARELLDVLGCHAAGADARTNTLRLR